MGAIYTFGSFKLNAELDVLSRGEQPLPLGRRAVVLLRVLIERPGAPVSKEAMIEATWAATLAQALELPESTLFERVDDEWSFVETLRHLILATDAWLRRMVKGIEHPYHSWGLAGSWLTDPASWGLDYGANPLLGEVLAVRRDRMEEVKATVADLTQSELERICQPPTTPGHPNREHSVLECLHVILNEEWEHHRYAVRDLGIA